MRTPMFVLAIIAAACGAQEPASESTPMAQTMEMAIDQPPLSAYAALRGILALVEQTAGGSVVVQDVECRTVAASAAKEGHVRARLDLAVPADDSILGTRTWSKLLAALEGAEWCLEVDHASSRTLPEDRGILVSGVVVLVDARKLREESREREAVQDLGPELHARMAATMTDIGQIDCSVSMRQPAPSVQEEVYRFRPPMKQNRYLLTSLLVFFQQLESLAGGVVTAIKLSPFEEKSAGEPIEKWVFDVELTVRGA